MGGLLDQPITLMADLRTVRTARVHHANSRQTAKSLQSQVDDLMAQIPGMNLGGS